MAGPGVVVTQTVNRAYQFYRSAFLYLRRDLLAHNSATIAKTGDDKAKLAVRPTNNNSAVKIMEIPNTFTNVVLLQFYVKAEHTCKQIFY